MRVLLSLCAALVLAVVTAGGARALEVIGAGDDSVDIERNQGVLVRLDEPVATVFVADAEIADVQVKSPRLVYVFGKKVGQTTLFAVNADEKVVASERVHVRHNLTGLQRALGRLDPAQPIEATAVDGALVLRGRVASAEAAEDARRIASQFAGADNVINRLEVTGPTQVNLRVRVAEVERSISKDFGIRWDDISGALFGEFFSFSGGSGTGEVGAFGVDFNISSGSLNIDGFIDVLADEGLVSILAEPNLTAVSGETASFLAGGEFPIPVSQDEDTITVTFKEFGVRLQFTPVILGDGRISLAVEPEVSELNFAEGVAISETGIRVPALNTRRARTTIELASGQSFAIAGLLQSTQNHDISKLPGLGDLPVLGALFRSDSFRRGETELAIIVTPYIVEPSSAQQLAAPTDGLIPPNDAERILFGKLYGENAARRLEMEKRLGGRELAGPVGFMLE